MDNAKEIDTLVKGGASGCHRQRKKAMLRNDGGCRRQPQRRMPKATTTDLLTSMIIRDETYRRKTEGKREWIQKEGQSDKPSAALESSQNQKCPYTTNASIWIWPQTLMFVSIMVYQIEPPLRASREHQLDTKYSVLWIWVIRDLNGRH